MAVEIGIRLQWWGLRPPPRTFDTGFVDPERLNRMIADIEWSGRLFRDSRITRAEAIERTQRSVWDNAGYRYVDFRDRGFVFFGLPQGDTTRVNLIGVLPEHRGRGIARALIACCPTLYVIAGTYEDNKAACALYRRFGWKVVKRERIVNE